MSEALPTLESAGEAPFAGEPYRRIGPFDAGSLPAGLRAEHRLKPEAWGRVTLLAGSLRFVWDDGSGRVDEVSAPAEIAVPPQVPHHVEGEGPFELTIAFYRGD
jgi:tellurite resistance-related uncharacterized protein